MGLRLDAARNVIQTCIADSLPRSRSVWLGYIPTLQVDPLAALLVNTSSPLYRESKNITSQLVSRDGLL